MLKDFYAQQLKLSLLILLPQSKMNEHETRVPRFTYTFGATRRVTFAMRLIFLHKIFNTTIVVYLRDIEGGLENPGIGNFNELIFI